MILWVNRFKEGHWMAHVSLVLGMVPKYIFGGFRSSIVKLLILSIGQGVEIVQVPP